MIKSLGRLGKIQDSRSAMLVQDIEGSVGNYIKDVDGNVLLDVYCQIASIAIGYNNPGLLNLARSEKWVRASVNRPALGVFPPTDWAETLENSFLRVAPKGLNQVFTAGCGSTANEIAFKAAFMYQQTVRRGNKDFTAEELESCLLNEAPGSPDTKILSFRTGFHGTLSATRSKSIHKVDIPSFSWPVAPFPDLRYPLHENVEYNHSEESRCLDATEKLIKKWDSQVAAIIVEPIQGEGGDNHATPYFFKGLREITKRNNVLMIVDEVQTGAGCTGKFWAHEHWELDTPPDFVVFSKRLQSAGVYHNLSTRPPQPFRNFNTWMGDPIRAYQAEFMINEILTHNLAENATVVGEYLKEGLNKLSTLYPTQVSKVRGQGTFIAFDCENTEIRDKIALSMRQHGYDILMIFHKI
ncbi:hypothetical protein HK099_003617 [Clydaea vesicula]|uniref:4-aminobutyrate--2-oxoglutarate transaminase n=1 Tax=Clydaea vesicula TaxID=447962 RepID=A0AAD5XW78_9FUNG|nr:hypothetical protein HK099_003617 [Clydaea vesicula]